MSPAVPASRWFPGDAQSCSQRSSRQIVRPLRVAPPNLSPRKSTPKLMLCILQVAKTMAKSAASLPSPPDNAVEYDGVPWERRVKQWLRLRYPHGEFEEVPADHQGDCGIEGFSRDGIAYQCYAPSVPMRVKELYESQRDKITEDIGKLIGKKTDLILLFGPLKLKSWWLVVPQHRSAKLVQHATKKTREVHEAQLPYIEASFYIHIANPDEFSIERKKAAESGLTQLNLHCATVLPEDVTIWSDTNDRLAATLDAKISAYSGEADKSKLKGLRDSWVEVFIRSENLLRSLKENAPAIWEQLRALKVHRENKLFLRYFKSTAPEEVLHRVISEVKEEVLQAAPNLGSMHAEDIAIGTVAEWLHRCPLDFPRQ